MQELKQQEPRNITKASLTKKTKSLEQDFIELYNLYKHEHTQFDTFRGRKVESKEDIAAVVKILDEMGSLYEKMAIIMNFVLVRYKPFTDIAQHAIDFNKEVTKGTDMGKP